MRKSKSHLAFEDTAIFANPESIAIFQKHIDPVWIEDILSITGTATLRRRRLPAEQVLWLVLGMGLFRNRPISEVVSKLDLVLPASDKPTVAPSAITQARARMGEEPIKWLFERCSHEWAHKSADRNRWRGLSIYGVDGSTCKLPDSNENRIYFGGPSGGENNESGYPDARIVSLLALRSHLLAGAAFGPYWNSEYIYAKQLWPLVPENSLTIVDKGFFSADVLLSLSNGGENRHWLIRSKKNTKWRVIENLGPGDELVEMEVSKQARLQNPDLPKTWIARAIQYERKGFRPQILLTSLLDQNRYPSSEIASLYHERWELELSYDEIKTDLLTREETIRSMSPAGIRQEIWGILMAYNLIRLEMEQIAIEAKVEPTRISFVMAMRLIQDEWMWCALATPGSIPAKLRRLREKVKLFILPKRRTERAYPRAVKVVKSKYPSKRKFQLAEVLK